MSTDKLPLLAGGEIVGLANTALEIGKEIWRMMDATVEKPKPTDYLSKKGIRAVQGLMKLPSEGEQA